MTVCYRRSNCCTNVSSVEPRDSVGCFFFKKQTNKKTNEFLYEGIHSKIITNEFFLMKN